MGKRDIFTKILAITGMVLVWVPILAPILFSVATLARVHIFRFDYLIPAELFPTVLIGGGLLLWAAFRARSQKKMIGWGLGIAVGLFVAGLVLSVVSGLASGAREPTGFL